MTASQNLTEARRWLAQALHDRDAATLNRDHGFHEHACFQAQQSAEKALNAFPVLGHSTLAPANVPHDFYDRTLSDQAIADLDAVIAEVLRFVAPA